MGRSVIPPALIELTNPTSPETQVDALRDVKNEIVGHDQRKELAVRHGVVAPLVRILQSEARKGKKRRTRVLNGGASAAGAGRSDMEKATAEEWSSEDEMRLQATLVVGSLALGGPAFVAPLLAGNILPSLLEALSPNEVSPKLVLATLRTLILVADAVSLDKPWAERADGPLRPSVFTSIAEHLYTKPVIDSLSEILSQSSISPTIHQQISLAAQLLSKTCHEEEQKKLVLNAGILELLATKLAGIATSDEGLLREAGVELKTPARDVLPSIYLADILEAIGTIISKSFYRMARFIYAPAILSIFPIAKVANESSIPPYDGYSNSPTPDSPWDRLLPRLQAVQNKSESSFSRAFPALGTISQHVLSDSYSRMPSFADSVQPATREMSGDEFESRLFAWLIAIARRGQTMDRLAATWVLSLLKKFDERYYVDDSAKNRERKLALLMVPLIVKMIEESSPLSDQTKKGLQLSPQARLENRIMLERAPAVLAELIEGSKELQKAAVDAKILPTLCQILKKSFDPAITSSKPLWSPRPPSPNRQDPSVDGPSSTLGRPGLSPDILHALKYRESSLKAIGAIAEREDNFRKMIIELGAVSCVTDSMVPYPKDQADSNETAFAKQSNPVPVLLAACTAARSLSRSVSVLRTSLIDNGLAKPVVGLFKHSDVNVQIAATEVICNLVLEVSPMREDIIEAGAISTICSHCHSANTKLRFESIWALKHLILTAPFETKIRCLEELGSGWLVQAISGELRDSSGSQKERSRVSTPIGMGTPNAAGEQVDLLNAIDEPGMDIDDVDTSSSEDEDTMTDSIGTLRRQRLRHTSAAHIRSRLRAIKDEEQDPRVNAEKEDLRMQEQALDFIRNFLTDSKSSTEVIDHLLQTIGNGRFFEILDSKLRPKSTTTSTPYWTNPSSLPRTRHPQHASGPGTTFSATVHPQAPYPPTEILASTLFILVHLANGSPRHRSQLLSQTQLMTHILPLFSHPNRGVRVPCAWIVNNLTWVDDSSDQGPARERASVLRNLGFEERVRVMMGDVDLDVRERAKTAVEQLGKLLEGFGGFEGLRGVGLAGVRGLSGGWHARD